MVMHKRRSCPTSNKQLYGYEPSASQTALPYGESLDSPRRPAAFQRSISDSLKSSVSSLHNSHSPPSWILKFFVAVFAISWCAAIYSNYQMRASLKSLQVHYQIETLHYEEAKRTLDDASSSQSMLEGHVQNLERTKQALEHEVRMASELQVGETLALPHSSVSDVIKRRQAVLQDEVEALRAYIQEESRREVLEKFGPGPHRVKLTVVLRNTKEEKTIILEMAPLDLMPHSVHVFLELVSHKACDNTLFWHHVGVIHLVPAMAISYDTGQNRHDRLHQMRLGGVSFAEYSDAYPHEMYTVGFAGRGPDFYINTLNNTKPHGYGGQKHYALDDEADPCFAKVVEGQDVVDALLQLSIQETNTHKREKQKWQDLALTQIVRAEILGWKAPQAMETKTFQQLETVTTKPRRKTPKATKNEMTKPPEEQEISDGQTAKAPETKTPQQSKTKTTEQPQKITVKQMTAAHIAARANNLQELRRVVEANEELVNIQDENGWTPLIEAIRSKNLEMCEFLLERGADVNARTIHKDGLGGSSLFWAYKFLNNDDPIISRLRSYGAKHYVPLSEEEVPLPIEYQTEL